MHIAYILRICGIFTNVYGPGGSSFSNICIHYPFKWIRTCQEPIDSALERDIGQWSLCGEHPAPAKSFICTDSNGIIPVLNLLVTSL